LVSSLFISRDRDRSKLIEHIHSHLEYNIFFDLWDFVKAELQMHLLETTLGPLLHSWCLDIITHQAALSYALPNEEPASHLSAHNHIYGSLAHSPFPEGLLLKIGNLGRNISNGDRDLPRRRWSQLNLCVSEESVQLRPGNLHGSIEQGRGLFDKSSHFDL